MYTPTTWINGQPPPIDAAHLQNMETGIAFAVNAILTGAVLSAGPLPSGDTSGTNDTVALQATINKIGSTRGVLALPFGATYYINPTLVCPFDDQTWLTLGVTFVLVGMTTNSIGVQIGSLTARHFRPGTIGAGAIVSTTVTVTNASVTGNVDTVRVGFSDGATGLPAGVIAFGSVTSSSTVTVTIVNMSGSPVTIGAGTLRCDVAQY